MRVGERYHGVVRRIYNRVADAYSALDPDLILAAAVKVINDSARIDGIVPTLLVFGAIPKLPYSGSEDGAIPQRDRLAQMTKAREEYAHFMDQERLSVIAQAQEPTTPIGLCYGEKGCVFRRTTKT